MCTVHAWPFKMSHRTLGVFLYSHSQSRFGLCGKKIIGHHIRQPPVFLFFFFKTTSSGSDCFLSGTVEHVHTWGGTASCGINAVYTETTWMSVGQGPLALQLCFQALPSNLDKYREKLSFFALSISSSTVGVWKRLENWYGIFFLSGKEQCL